MLNGALVASAELQNDVQAINAETEAFIGNNTLHLSAGAGDLRRRLSETRAKNSHNDHIHVEGQEEKTAAQVVEAKATKRAERTCLEPNGPVPFILLTLGRSGSGSTWQIIGNLTGQETPSEELTGSSSRMSEKFFASLSSQNDSRWMLDNLCSKQQKYPLAGAVGFKWKPFPATFFGQPAKAALETVALSDSPQIRVIRNRRNLLDIVISSYKHERANVKAHCLRGDKRCLLRHQKFGTGLVLPTKELLNRLKTLSDAEDRVDRMLEEMEVPHVQVTYERLYYGGDDTSEWTKIFRFLGRGPSEGISRAQLEGAMHLVATHNPSQKSTLANFEAVSKVLTGTKFEDLLH